MSKKRPLNDADDAADLQEKLDYSVNLNLSLCNPLIVLAGIHFEFSKRGPVAANEQL